MYKWERKKKRKEGLVESRSRRYEFRARSYNYVVRQESDKWNEWNIPRFYINEAKREHFGKVGGREGTEEREREIEKARGCDFYRATEADAAIGDENLQCGNALRFSRVSGRNHENAKSGGGHGRGERVEREPPPPLVLSTRRVDTVDSRRWSEYVHALFSPSSPPCPADVTGAVRIAWGAKRTSDGWCSATGVLVNTGGPCRWRTRGLLAGCSETHVSRPCGVFHRRGLLPVAVPSPYRGLREVSGTRTAGARGDRSRRSSPGRCATLRRRRSSQQKRKAVVRAWVGGCLATANTHAHGISSPCAPRMRAVAVELIPIAPPDVVSAHPE